MLKRWLLRPSETPPPSPLLPDPRNAETPENMVHANAEVEKILTTKRKRGEYNNYNSKQHVLRWQDMQLNNKQKNLQIVALATQQTCFKLKTRTEDSFSETFCALSFMFSFYKTKHCPM